MSVLSDNLRYLRSRNKLSQKAVADHLGIERGRYSKYEESKSEPPYEILLRMGRFYHISIEILIGYDVSKVDLNGSLTLKDNRIVLPMKVNCAGENMIEIIPHAAKAGYLSGYSDPDFIDRLQCISIPFLKDGKYRAFPIEGDSMPPHQDGSYIVGSFVESFDQMLCGKTFVILTKSDGIIYKRLNGKKRNALVLGSDNADYQLLEVKKSDILEIWQYEVSFATKEY